MQSVAIKANVALSRVGVRASLATSIAFGRYCDTVDLHGDLACAGLELDAAVGVTLSTVATAGHALGVGEIVACRASRTEGDVGSPTTDTSRCVAALGTGVINWCIAWYTCGADGRVQALSAQVRHANKLTHAVVVAIGICARDAL